METTTVLLIAIPVLVVLAGVVLFASARRRDTGEAIGALARETRQRDRGAVALTDDAEAPVTGKEVERAAVIERREASQALATVGATAPVAWVPPDPEALDVSRRQFLNRGIVTFFGLGLAGFGASLLAFLWPKLGRRLRCRHQHRQHARASTRRSPRAAASPTTPRAGCGSPTTRRPRCPARPAHLHAGAARHGGRATRRSTRSACTSAAACPSARRRSGSSASATGRSTTATARRRAARRRVASTASRSPSSGGNISVDTGIDHPGPADRHQHHRPGGRGSALRRRRGEH